MSLFDDKAVEPPLPPNAPLAIRMRPRTMAEFVGQEHFAGEGQLLRRMLQADRLTSLLFYGPPGTGKTALARVVANATQATFEDLNAAMANVAEVREVLQRAKARLARNERTVLFLDELHRFNRAQQDVLLPDVERGTLRLIGATTMNPFFAINAPLLSRSTIFEFKPLTRDDIKTILRRALADPERGLGRLRVEITEEALDHLVEISDGDARRARNALEIGVLSAAVGADGIIRYDLTVAEESIQRKAVVYDRDDDQHYDTISAFIKSMRGSDPDAALYWLAKMLEGGEDPRFIARRVLICAAEDVGNAAPNALVLATAAFHAVEFIGLPEAQIPLAQAVTYIACAPKSNAAYMGICAARKDVQEGRTLPVPDALKGTGYKGAKRLGHGEGYKYAHDYDDHWVDQDYIPTTRIYYRPTEEGHEKEQKARLDAIRRARGILDEEGKEDGKANHDDTTGTT